MNETDREAVSVRWAVLCVLTVRGSFRSPGAAPPTPVAARAARQCEGVCRSLFYPIVCEYVPRDCIFVTLGYAFLIVGAYTLRQSCIYTCSYFYVYLFILVIMPGTA